MITILTLVLIMVGTAGVLLLAHKLRSTHFKNEHLLDLSQAGFLSNYILDKTQTELFDRDKDSAMNLGREMLWEEANTFGILFSKASVNGMEEGNFELLNSAVKIVKIAHTMCLIEQGEEASLRPKLSIENA